MKTTGQPPKARPEQLLHALGLAKDLDGIDPLEQSTTLDIFGEMPIGIALADEDGRVAYANSAAERMFGYEQGELNDQPVEILVPGALREAHLKHKAGFLVQPKARIMAAGRELRGRRKDGSEIALQIGLSSIWLGDRRVVMASIADLTERRAIERVLRKHEEQRAMIFSEGLLGDFTWNIERDEVEAHPTVFKLYGSPPISGPVPGNWFRSRHHPDDLAEIQQKWLDQIAAAHDVAVEFRVNGDDGITRWVDCRGVVVRDSAGKPYQIHGLNMDISARKHAEIERCESEARARNAEEQLRTALQFSGAVVWRWLENEDVLEWSGPAIELTGIHPSALANSAAFNQIIFPADIPSFEKAVARCRDTGSELRNEFRIVRPDGEIRWLVTRGGVLRDAEGNISGMTGVNFDVTKRKIAEEELKQSERDFRELTNVIPQIVFIANSSGAIEYHNDRYYQMIGSPRGSQDLRWHDLIVDEDRGRFLEGWHTSVASGQPYEVECRIWDRQRNENRWHLVRAVPVRNAENAVVRWIGTSTEIHDQKAAEERLETEVQSRTLDLNRSLTLLRRHEEQLRNSLKEKEALLREIHHRVKNNLQIVSSLLSMQATNAGESEAVAPLRDSERRIYTMAMIHEQLYGTDDLQTVDFAAHAQRLSESLLASMAKNPLLSCRLDLRPVSLAIHQAIPCALILNELLTNALKYAYPNGEGGEITVGLSADQDEVILGVSDKGVGLPPSVDPYLPKTLGLEIVQVLANQLEGELRVVRSPGASFSVRFRRDNSDAPPTDLPAESAPAVLQD